MAIGISTGSNPVSSSSAPQAARRSSAPQAETTKQSAGVDRFEGEGVPQSGAGAASNLLNGLMGAFAPKLSLSPEQREQIKEAAPTLQKLAGADKKWGPADLADNVQAVGGGVIQRTLVEGQLRKGFEEMTGKPVDKLTPEQKAAARQRWDTLSDQQKKESRIGVDELRGLKPALDSVKASTPLTQFAPKTDGISGDLLKKLSEVPNPTVKDLLEAQKTPAEGSAKADEAGAGEASPPSAAPAEAAAPPASEPPPPPVDSAG